MPNNVNIWSEFPGLYMAVCNENIFTLIVSNNVDGCDHFYSYEVVSRIPDEC